ncbi:MAG: helix-turn-helix domain-containing protein [Thermoguttaceae bacterium]|jgi:hypothetical protein
MNQFKNWIREQLEYLDDLSANWELSNDPCDSVGWVIEQAADRAAKLGLSELYRRSLNLRRTISDGKWYLSECLCCLPAVGNSPLMTEDELIAYLRLDADDRKPLDRLRNLIRRQRLPVIHRGRLLLFRKTAIDEWLQEKQEIILKYESRARARQNVNPRRIKV